MSYPVIVKGPFTAEQATAIYCVRCGWRGVQKNPADGLICDVGSCPSCNLLTLDYCYEEGVECGGCGKLAVDHPLDDAGGQYCSRVCQLQAEYRRKLGAAR